jgi:phosphate transport system protein
MPVVLKAQVDLTAAPRGSVDAVLASLLTMAGLVENSIRRTLYALRQLKPGEASQVFLGESRINEMEVEIDEKVIELLAAAPVPETELHLLIATLRITNDLERLGDQAVNVAERVVSLRSLAPFEMPRELIPMADAVEEMVSNSLRALSARRVELAQQVLESDDQVDGYADTLARGLGESMERDSKGVAPHLQLLLASRTLERMADHATNIAEDVIFWLRGLDVRHRFELRRA